LLFSFFVNDLHEYFSQSNLVHGSVLEKHSNDDRMIEFLKLFVLLYADDTIIVAENAHDLQNALNIYEYYCTVNKLTINTCKTKIIIFSKGRLPNYDFYMCNDPIDVVSEYKYLGLVFAESGSFFRAKEHIAKQATNAMNSLLKKQKIYAYP